MSAFDLKSYKGNVYTLVFIVWKNPTKKTLQTAIIFFYFAHPLVATCSQPHRCPHHTLGIRGWHDHQQGPGLFFFCSAVCHPLLSCCCSIKPGHIKHSYSCKPGKLRAWLFLIDSSGWSRKHEAVLNLYSRLVSCRQTATVVWGFLRVIFEVILMVWYCYGWYCQPNICTLQYIHISSIYKHM